MTDSNKALKIATTRVPPIQGYDIFESNTQGCTRASLALGWFVGAPLVLKRWHALRVHDALHFPTFDNRLRICQRWP